MQLAARSPASRTGAIFANVCVDFSLDGLIEARRLLGVRAICVCGSLLQLPLKDGAFHGVLASHCLYHIDKDLQKKAIDELLRVLAPGGTLLILYGNPEWSNPISKGLAKIRALRRFRRRSVPRPMVAGPGAIYTHLRSIDWMLNALSQDGLKVSVKPLCAFTRTETERFFKRPLLGRLWFGLVRGLDRLWRNRPERCYYVAYVVKRP
jgi:SAM-dependent methyltransferase